MPGNARPRLSLTVVLAVLVLVGAVLASWGAMGTTEGRASRTLSSSRSDYRLNMQSREPGDVGLISRLAMLRRAQASTDVLPAGVNVAGDHGMIIASLTWLAASLPQASLYLAVSTPLGGSLPLVECEVGGSGRDRYCHWGRRD